MGDLIWSAMCSGNTSAGIGATLDVHLKVSNSEPAQPPPLPMQLSVGYCCYCATAFCCMLCLVSLLTTAALGQREAHLAPGL